MSDVMRNPPRHTPPRRSSPAVAGGLGRYSLDRRSFCRGALGMGAVLVAGPLLTACDDGTGPIDIHYDRDTCELCRMIISDPRFATEVRGGPRHQVHKFDDLGDAIHWLKDQPWKNEADVEIWVSDYEHPGTWLNAREAVYVTGVISPMDYGWAAVAGPHPGGVAFAEMRDAVIERGVSSRCDPSLLLPERAEAPGQSPQLGERPSEAGERSDENPGESR